MKIKSIEFAEEIRNETNDNIDVFVENKSGYTYTVSVGIPQDLLEEMKQEKTNFVQPGPSKIIVKKLTEEIVTEAIHAYAEDNGYWLKLSYFGNDINISVLDQVQAEEVKQPKKDTVIQGLDGLKDKINKIATLDPDSFKKEQSDILANLNELYQFLDSEPL